MRRTEWAVSFNLWTMQGTWFWSLVYPDRHGGAIGAAASKAEAMREAQAAIERLPQLRDEMPLASCDDSGFTRQFQRSREAQFHIAPKTGGTTNDFANSHALPKQNSKMQTMGQRCNNLWQLMLRQYAARVAAA